MPTLSICHAPVVYFATLKSGLIKIGCTGNLKARLAALRHQSNHNEPVTLLGTMPGDLSEEARIHGKFGRHRVRSGRLNGPREEFRPVKRLLQFIARLPA